MKVIIISNIYSEFSKLVEQIKRLVLKNGNFEVIILTGEVFNKNKGLDDIHLLFDFNDSKFVIFDNSPISNILKHNFEIDNKLISNYKYFLKYKDHNCIQLNNNIYLLINSGVININNLNIAFIQGFEHPDMLMYTNNNNNYNCNTNSKNFNNRIFFGSYFRKQDYIFMEDVIHKKIDILLLHSLPKLMYDEFIYTNYFENKNSQLKESSNTEFIIDIDKLKNRSSFLCNSLLNISSPRYCFVSTGEDFYFEKQPFINKNIPKTLTRIYHLASFPSNNIQKVNIKEKYIYAFNIEPLLVFNEIKNIYDKNNNISMLNEEEVKNYKTSPFDSFNYIKNFNYSDNDLILKNKSIIKDEIYIGNINPYTSEEKLINVLTTNFGKVNKLVYPISNEYNKLALEDEYNTDKKEKHKHLGYAFVKFENHVLSLHNKVLIYNGKILLDKRKLIFDERIVDNKNKFYYECTDNNNNISLNKNDTLYKLQNKSSSFSCWFCYENPKIDLNLIINSESYRHFYVAYPKGAIDDLHFLIIPKTHIFSCSHFDDEHKNECKHIIDNLYTFIKKHYYEVIIYEKYLPYSDDVFKHVTISIIGIDQKPAEDALEIFKYNLKSNLSYKDNYDIIKFSSISQAFMTNTSINNYQSNNLNLNEDSKDSSYYYNIVFPTGLLDKAYYKLTINVSKNQTDNSDYIRKIICKLINKEENTDWRKSMVKAHDFNLLKTTLNSLYLKEFKQAIDN